MKKATLILMRVWKSLQQITVFTRWCARWIDLIRSTSGNVMVLFTNILNLGLFLLKPPKV